MTRSWTDVKSLRVFLMLLAAFALNANRAEAVVIPPFDADMEMSSGGIDGCTDPNIGPDLQIDPFSANANGGGCFEGFNNSGQVITNMRFQTLFAVSDLYACSGADLFTDCGFSLDGGVTIVPTNTFLSTTSVPLGTMLTILFFGTDGTHQGIGVEEAFKICLNSPCARSDEFCDYYSRDGVGNWGAGAAFTGEANVPEPSTVIPLLFGCAAAVLARRRRRTI